MLGEIMTLSLSLFGGYVGSTKMCMSAKLTRGGLVMSDFRC